MKGGTIVAAVVLARAAAAQTDSASSDTVAASPVTTPGPSPSPSQQETVAVTTLTSYYTPAPTWTTIVATIVSTLTSAYTPAPTWTTVIVTLTAPTGSSASSPGTSVSPTTTSTSSSTTPTPSAVTSTSATPSPSAPAGKPAAITDVCDLGYGTQNGGTKGGAGGAITTVSTVPELKAAVSGSTPGIILVKGALIGNGRVDVGSSKSIIGAAGSFITGVNFRIKKQSNVIIRNMNISKVVGNDGITVENSKNIWIDHCDLSSDLSHDKDYYDGALDITHGSDWVTVSNTYFHDHWKTSLVGHSDKNGDEDQGHLRVTYAYNHWYNINSRAPSFRFGTGHVYNSYFNKITSSGIHTRMGAQLLVQSSVFEDTKKAIMSDDGSKAGYATVEDVSLGGSTNSAPKGTIAAASVPYKYSLLGSGKVKAAVLASAGQTLRF